MSPAGVAPCKAKRSRVGPEIRRLTAVARDGKATSIELASGTFTLNNYGVFGVDGSAAIINYPEVAMLGVGPSSTSLGLRTDSWPSVWSPS